LRAITVPPAGVLYITVTGSTFRRDNRSEKFRNLAPTDPKLE